MAGEGTATAPVVWGLLIMMAGLLAAGICLVALRDEWDDQ
jgi:hypothetical protein